MRPFPSRPTRRRPSERGYGPRGYSLLEVTVALAILGVALLLTMALLAQEPRVRRRLDAHQEALERIEMALEDMRANSWLPEDGEVLFQDWVSPPSTHDLRIWAEVHSLPERQLYHVTLRATYHADGRGYEQSIETMVWNARYLPSH